LSRMDFKDDGGAPPAAIVAGDLKESSQTMGGELFADVEMLPEGWQQKTMTELHRQPLPLEPRGKCSDDGGELFADVERLSIGWTVMIDGGAPPAAVVTGGAG